MLSFFPSPYKDELLYSWLARYHRRSGNKSFKQTLVDLYGVETKVPITDLPGNLMDICNRINNIYTSNYLLAKHTLFHYYSPFLPKDRENMLKKTMINSDASGVHMFTGITASGIKYPRFLRYCIKCYQEEVTKYGEAYWHRSHQLSGVFICPFHLQSLNESNIPFKVPMNKQRFYDLNEIEINDKGKAKLLQSSWNHLEFISKQSLTILELEISPLGLEKIRDYYVYKLREKGFVTVSSRIRFRDFLPEFIKYIGSELLSKLDSDIDKNAEDTWIHKLLRKPRVSCHPLRHLLLIRFLDEDIATLNNIKGNHLQYEPFGSPPYPCLNKTANHYLDSVMTRLEITNCYETGKPVGTFTCGCGFVYSRRGPDQLEEDRFKVGRIKNYGELWENKLRELYQKKVPLVKIAEKIGADRSTVSKYIKKLDSGYVPERRNGTNKEKRDLYRVKWIKHKEKNPQYSRTRLRETLSSVYIWLYRNDKYWLFENLPPKKVNKQKAIRVNWKMRDEKLSMLIKEEGERIKGNEDDLVRVTISAIGKQLGILSLLEKQLDVLPKCKEALNEVTETIEEFQIRRIKIKASQMRNLNIEVKEWRIMRYSGLGECLNPDVLNAIDKEINKGIDL
ncbi:MULTISPECIES: TnsD family Tn7-like transposition protein [unclassified Virgibacillus]|uniref:TnsD family Tn7-like transposition protein n=1 Tax=unclassified Virgibacillus TaxID=2620237 RepID=UPI0013CF15BC|nr:MULTISPECIES: TnsD family Tn7-like transposition protein [unclassified Virgibacillus]MDY7046525.1 TnsD family transposase [Virgibacillus sp. M23]